MSLISAAAITSTDNKHYINARKRWTKKIQLKFNWIHRGAAIRTLMNGFGDRYLTIG